MRKILIVLLVLVTYCCGTAQAQSHTWDYNDGYLDVGSTPVTLSTYDETGMAVNEAIQLQLSEIYALNTAPGGIIADISMGGSVTVGVYLFDPHKPGNLGPVLYSCYTNATSTTYTGLSTTITENPANKTGDQVWTDFVDQSGFNNLASRSSTNIAITAYPASYAYKQYAGITTGFITAFSDHIPVILNITAQNATVKRIRIPGIGDFAPYDAFFQPAKNINNIVNVFKHPASYPNYLMVAAHRGYFRDVPDNSLEALRLAIGLNVPMVEVDIQLSKDSVWMLSHDALIGQTERTRVPARLQSLYNYCISIGKKGIPVDTLTLCDLRPDLCDDQCPYGATSGPCEPVWLAQQDGPDSVPIPTNESAMFLCKQKVLYDMDKIDKSKAGAVSVKNSRFDLAWKEVEKMGLQDKAIVKGTGNTWLDPQMLIDSFPGVDWKTMMYTPTYFADTKLANGSIAVSQTAVDAWFANANLECPGIELIYLQVNDPAYNLISHIKTTKGKQVIQFPMWPEYCDHIITDERIDYRNSWNWLLDNSARRPTLIISDRLEVLLQLLAANGLQVGL